MEQAEFEVEASWSGNKHVRDMVSDMPSLTDVIEKTKVSERDWW